MNYFAHRGALYCDACMRKVQQLQERRKRMRPTVVAESPICDAEADTPQHCDSGPSCLRPTRVGKARHGRFLENPLTPDGVAYVETLHRERPTAVTAMWARHYGLQ